MIIFKNHCYIKVADDGSLPKRKSTPVVYKNQKEYIVKYKKWYKADMYNAVYAKVDDIDDYDYD
jgi:hypothetical protein